MSGRRRSGRGRGSRGGGNGSAATASTPITGGSGRGSPSSSNSSPHVNPSRGYRSSSSTGRGNHPSNQNNNSNNSNNNNNTEGRGRKSGRSPRRRSQDDTNSQQQYGGNQQNHSIMTNNSNKMTTTQMRDEDVLIAFLPYLKRGNVQAMLIHEAYQNDPKQEHIFMQQAREFLEQQQQLQLPDEQEEEEEVKPEEGNTISTTVQPNPWTTSSMTTTASIHAATTNTFVPPPSPPNRNPVDDMTRMMMMMSTGSSGTVTSNPFAATTTNTTTVSSGSTSIWQNQTPSWGPVVNTTPISAAATASSSHTANLFSIPPQGNNFQMNNNNDNNSHTSFHSFTSQKKETPSTPTSVTMQNDIRPTPTVITTTTAATTTSTKKDIPLPKRLWTNVEEQPGILRVEGISGHDTTTVLTLSPRQELSAVWSLPLAYLQSKQTSGGASTLEQALKGYTIGLFRRGCTENGSQASIISKAVLGDDHRSYEYRKEGNVVCGRVPFYSPRTPGHVVFRMYNEAEPIYTLATGPSLLVRVREEDFESSIRFILSNFKGKKSNPTSLSSLLSLASVLETPLSKPNDSAARATWGCIQEARKVIDACFTEYTKCSQKMTELETAVESLQLQVEEEEHDIKSQALSTSSEFDHNSIDGETEIATELREKTKTLMSGKASCERKWRDSQLAFSSILRAVVTNPTMHILLRRDLLLKMRIEYELWCPLSEEFAIPASDSDGMLWYEAMRSLPNPITADAFAEYRQAKIKMQQRTLNFEPNTYGLEDILFPRNLSSPEQRAMDPRAVSLFNSLSAAMGKYYHELFMDEESIVQKRELVRMRVEQLVRESGAFPGNAKVVIFGSSANGFGSPKSDIDMCLQLPEGSDFQGEDSSGSQAMAKLALKLEESGMKGVDTCRLTARIPILMFQCPNPLSGDAEDLIDCDLSMQNPLAVLNTSFLRCYAEITPITRVLAAIIKRWAKARDINNPAKHTLSSYGYIIMLLHFLTYHKRTGNGLLSPVAPVDGNPDISRQRAPQPIPILPNFHWMDPRWPGSPPGTPYIEVSSLPRNMIKHPLVEDKMVNTYFSRPTTPEQRAHLQMQFSGQDLSLGILLTSFFRYFAYEFNYKRHVVSLHSTASRGVVEREIKAELDGWRNYSAALTIEDPFETFYDVAHVLRGGYYHRIRREFAVAYSKIADAASGRSGSWDKGDLRSITGAELIDWLCEPVSTECE